MNTLILFNGPPRSGKDTLCEYMAAKHGFTHLKFAYHMFNDLKLILGLSDEQFKYYREEAKDEPMFNGKSFRQMAIDYSEKVVIPRYGQYAWVEALSKDLEKISGDVCVSDLGFEREVTFLQEYCRLRSWNLKIVQVVRPGYTFENDSREYVSKYHYRLVNDSNIEDLVAQSLNLL